MRVNKKSQTGVNAAILIALISLLIIIYIIFLPESEKREILKGNESSEVRSGAERVKVLLEEFPGTISGVFGVEDEKRLPNVFLIETKNARELARINPFIVTAGVFSQKPKTEEFELREVDNVENAVLSFNAKAKEGILTIKLNDRVIYENEIVDSAEPVRLNKNDLREKNAIEFSVNKPSGIAFWKTNKYGLENVRIVGDITDKSQQESSNLFVLKDEEFNNLEKAEIKFVPYCSLVRDVGRLDILVNGREIFSAIPVCDDPYKQVIPASALKKGENSIVFKTNKGSYSIEQIIIVFEFKEARTPVHYFQLTEEEFDDLNQSRKNLMLTMKFVDDDEIKDLTLDINGFKKTIDTEDITFRQEINVNKTREGNNFIRLIPDRNDIDVVELKVELVKK